MQVQIDTFGTYGAFVTMDTTLMSDSLDLKPLYVSQEYFLLVDQDLYLSLQRQILFIP